MYNSCESTVKVHFATLTLMLHLEALKSMLQYTTDLQTQLEETEQELGESTTRSVRLSRTISTLSVSLLEDAKKKG